ncbi:MAG: hypothetical protein D6689_06465 [Deltaproteobacteria bacterium]|nr:MAG: hypothetical protein D6689_06465 [Deltaproteobacteria bacterium]
MSVPTVRGIKLRLEIGAAEIPLAPLRRRAATENGDSGLRAPRIAPPTVTDEFELRPIRDIALREILSHADGGKVRVHLPLEPRTVKKGPIAIRIPEGARVVIDLRVEGGRILRDRDHTRGDIVPDLELPLGLKVRGVYLDEADGSLIADIAHFPNVNLSWLSIARLRIPGTLDGLLALLFPDHDRADDAGAAARASTAPRDADDAAAPALPVRLAELRVEARDVVPRDRELSLGQAGRIALGARTRLDIDYSKDALEIGGDIEIDDADIAGAGFSLRGLRAFGAGSAALVRDARRRELVVELRCDDAAVASGRIDLVDGSHLELGETTAENLRIALCRRSGAAQFAVDAARIDSRIAGGVVMTRVGRKTYPVRVADMEIAGRARVSDRAFDLDVEVRGARIDAESVAVPLGVARIDVRALDASGSGRFCANSRGDYAFDGSLAVNADLAGGRIVSGPFSGRLPDEGTRVSLAVARIAGGARGVTEFDASGTADVRLASGSVPVGNGHRLQFSRGAAGTLALHAIRLQSGDAWPRIDAGLHLTAAADAVIVGGAVDLPSGVGIIDAPSIALGADGTLAVHRAVVEVASAASDADDAREPSPATGA